MALANFTSPTPDTLPPNTGELFDSPVKYAGNLSLDGYNIPSSSEPRLLHVAASEFVHEKDVLTLPKKQDQRGRLDLRSLLDLLNNIT